MTPERDGEVFETTLRALAALKGVQLEPAAIEIYWRALEHLTLDQVHQALTACVRGQRSMSQPNEILDAVTGSPELEAERLIADARRQAFAIGWCGTPTLAPALEHAIRSVFGSWQAFCGSEWTTYAQHRLKEALTTFVEGERSGVLQLTAGEARAALDDIRRRTLPATPKAPAHVGPASATPRPTPTTDDYDARMALLRRQAAQLRTEDSPLRLISKPEDQ